MSNEPGFFASWLAGVPSVQKDHVFTPVGKQSARMTELLNQRAMLVPGKYEKDAGEDVEDTERSLGEVGYTEACADLDRMIEEQLAIDHPDAPRVSLRGLSDEDIQDIQDEVYALDKEARLTVNQAVVESNVRMVARAFLEPKATPEDIEMLRRRLNQGEWARLVDAVNRLTHAESESVDLPKS